MTAILAMAFNLENLPARVVRALARSSCIFGPESIPAHAWNREISNFLAWSQGSLHGIPSTDFLTEDIARLYWCAAIRLIDQANGCRPQDDHGKRCLAAAFANYFLHSKEGVPLKFVRASRPLHEILDEVKQMPVFWEHVAAIKYPISMSNPDADVYAYGWDSLPEGKRTPDALLAALLADGNLLFTIEETERTPMMYLAAASNSRSVVEALPENLRSEEFFVDMTRLNSLSMRDVPDEFFTPSYFLSVLRSSPSVSPRCRGYLLMDRRRKKCMTPEVANLVYKMTRNLKNIPEHMITKEMAEDYIYNHNGEYMLADIPSRLITFEMSEAAVRANPASILRVPPEMHRALVPLLDAGLADRIPGYPEFFE